MLFSSSADTKDACMSQGHTHKYCTRKVGAGHDEVILAEMGGDDDAVAMPCSGMSSQSAITSQAPSPAIPTTLLMGNLAVPRCLPEQQNSSFTRTNR
jgi:hypothetical protein